MLGSYRFVAVLLTSVLLLTLPAGAHQLGSSHSKSPTNLLSPDGSEITRLLEEIAAIKAAGGVPSPSLYEALAQLQPPAERNRRSLDQGNDICPATVIAGVPYTDTGTTVGRTNNQTSCLANTAPDVIYTFTPAVTANYAVSLCGSSYDTILELRTGGACPGTANIGCNDDACGIQSHFVATLNAGVTYYIIVDGFASEAGNYTLNVAVDVPCDVACQPGDILECPEVVDTSHARLDCDGGCNPMGYGGVASFDEIACGQTICGSAFTYVRQALTFRDTDWYRFSIGNTQTVQATITSEFTTVVGIVDLNSCASPAFVVFSSTIPCQSLTVTAPALVPGTYALFIAPAAFTGIPTPLIYRASLMACTDCDVASSAVVISSVIDTMESDATTKGYCVPGLIPPGTIIEDYSSGLLFSAPSTSRLFWVDPSSGTFFDHATYYVLVDEATHTINSFAIGGAWPVVGGVEYNWPDLEPHEFFSGAAVAGGSGPFVSAPPIIYPRVPRDGMLDNGTKGALVISQADTTGNSKEAKCSKADVDSANSGLGPNNPNGPQVPDSCRNTLIRPTAADVCSALVRLGRLNPPLEKLYVYYTGHGSETGVKLRGVTIPWDTLAAKIKATGAKEVCVIWQSCHSERLLNALAAIGVNGYHIVSAGVDGSSFWEHPWDTRPGSGVTRFVIECMKAGLKGQDLFAWADSSYQAYIRSFCDSLHAKVVSGAISRADSANMKNKRKDPNNQPHGALTGGTTAKGGAIEVPPARACSTLCFTFYAPPGSCANATILCQRIVGSDTTWVRVRHWNFNRGQTRYFNPFENPDPNSTGRYRVVNDGNTEVLNVKVVWLLTQQPSTANSVYADAIPSHSVGWGDGTNREFNPHLTAGTFTSIIQDGFDTYEVPRCFGPAWPDTFRWHFPLLPHPEHPWLYNGSDPMTGFNLPTELRIYVAGTFQEFIRTEFGIFEVHIDFVDNPFGNYVRFSQTVQSFFDTGTQSYTPVNVLLPPIVRPFPVVVSLTAVQDFPFQIAVDAATLTAVGDYNEPSPGDCFAVDDLTVMRSAGQVYLNFVAPQDANYNIYSTTNPNHDRNPDGGLDPNFTFEGQIFGIAGQNLNWIAPPTTAGYKNFIVVANCGLGAPERDLFRFERSAKLPQEAKAAAK